MCENPRLFGGGEQWPYLKKYEALKFFSMHGSE